MLYMTTYEITPANRNDVQKRFVETGGPPPEGVKMLGRWVTPGGIGFCLSESDDIVSVAKWIQEWSDLLTFEIFPLMTDEQYAEVL